MQNNLHHRFVYEACSGWNTTGSFNLTTTAGAAGANYQVIVGNPFMAHWDFNAFYNDNSTLIKNEYKVLKGVAGGEGEEGAFTTWTEYTYPSGDLTNLIAPMQSILVTANQEFNTTALKTNVTSVAQNSGSTLKSSTPRSAAEENPDLLKITAEKDGTQNFSHILFSESASNDYLLSEDSYKLFVKYTTEPVVVYTRSSDGYALDINHFGDCSQTIPIGIRTSTTGTIALQFEGIDNFLPKYDVFLLDMEKDAKINLKETPAYSFEKTSEELFMDERLYLSFNKAPTDNLQPEQGTTVIYTKGKELHVISSVNINEVQVFDMQGRRILIETNIESLIYSHDLASNSMFIVKALTQDGVVVKKVITK
jgi:hypothetical protein